VVQLWLSMSNASAWLLRTRGHDLVWRERTLHPLESSGVQDRGLNTSSAALTSQAASGSITSSASLADRKPSTPQNLVQGLSEACGTEACFPYYWHPSPWSACSVSCGVGSSQRNVTCSQGGRPVDETLCAGLQRPSTEEACYPTPCQASAWRTTEWGPCQNTGGSLYANLRTVYCQEPDGSATSDQVKLRLSDTPPPPTNPAGSLYANLRTIYCQAPDDSATSVEVNLGPPDSPFPSASALTHWLRYPV